MAELSAAMKYRIAEVLEASRFTQRGFIVKHGGVDNVLAIIAFSACSEYRFVLGAAGSEFTTGECPGLHSDKTETFQRSDFESCLHAIQGWVKRLVEREEADILDEFGGVADSNPSYFKSS